MKKSASDIRMHALVDTMTNGGSPQDKLVAFCNFVDYANKNPQTVSDSVADRLLAASFNREADSRTCELARQALGAVHCHRPEIANAAFAKAGLFTPEA